MKSLLAPGKTLEISMADGDALGHADPIDMLAYRFAFASAAFAGAVVAGRMRFGPAYEALYDVGLIRRGRGRTATWYVPPDLMNSKKIS